MIDIEKLTEWDLGQYVVYITKFNKDIGRIKSWNDNKIFVVYNCGNEWKEYKKYTASSTNPEDLFFVTNMRNYR